MKNNITKTFGFWNTTSNLNLIGPELIHTFLETNKQYKSNVIIKYGIEKMHISLSVFLMAKNLLHNNIYFLF